MLTFHESFRPMNHRPGENDDCRSVDYLAERYAGPWRHRSGRPCNNYIGDKGGPERRALALGFLILRAQRRDGHACTSVTTPDGHGAYCRDCGATLA